MKKLRELAAKQYSAFSVAQAAACGVSEDALFRANRQGHVIRLQTSVFAIAGSPETWERSVMAACLAGGQGAVASHRAAARIWRLAADPSDTVEITVPRGRFPRLRGVIVHRSGDLVHYVVNTPAGLFLAEVDFAYPEIKLVIEVDGFDAHGTPRAMAKDFVRQNGLAPYRWHVLRFTWRQVIQEPGMVAATIRRTIEGLQAA